MVSVLARPNAVAANPETPDQESWRCGLVVSKAVGNAVVRHRVQRRLRHIVMDLMREGALEPVAGHSWDIVIRAFPEITSLDHAQLRAEVLGAAQRAQRKSLRRAGRSLIGKRPVAGSGTGLSMWPRGSLLACRRKR